MNDDRVPDGGELFHARSAPLRDAWFSRSLSQSFWNRVEPARMKWVAAAEAACCHPETSDYAIFAHRVVGVHGARWIKPAGGRQHGRYAYLVGVERTKNQPRSERHRSHRARPNRNVGTSKQT